MFEVILRELIDGIEGFLGLILVIAKQNFLNVRQTVAEEHVFCTEQANATGTLVEGGKRLGGFRVGADIEGLDFLAPVEDRLSGFFELAGNGHGDFAEVNFAGRTRNRDVITTFYGVAVAAECTGGFVDRDFGSTDDGGDAPCGLFGYFWSAVLFRFAQYARPSALYPQGIRAFAPGYVLDRCAVCAHTPGELSFSLLAISANSSLLVIKEAKDDLRKSDCSLELKFLKIFFACV